MQYKILEINFLHRFKSQDAMAAEIIECFLRSLCIYMWAIET